MFRFTHTDWETLYRAWIDGNEEGMGSPFGENGDTPHEAVAREGYEVLATSEDGKVLAHSKHKHYYLVIHDNGPWGVDVTIAARSIIGDEVAPHA